MEKIKLFVLAVDIWDAYDFLNDCNTDPRYTDMFLFATQKEAEEKAMSLNVGNDIYNFATLYQGELTEDEILELTGFDNMEEFNEALTDPYSTMSRVKNFGEDEKTEVARAIMEDPANEETVECANYDFNKSLDGCILVFWSWERFVGYARKCENIRRANSDDTETILAKQDHVFVTQCDILLTAEEVNNAENLQESILEALAKSSWKWTNPGFVRNEANNFE